MRGPSTQRPQMWTLRAPVCGPERVGRASGREGEAERVYRLPFTEARVSERPGGFLCYCAETKKMLAEWGGDSSTIQRLALRRVGRPPCRPTLGVEWNFTRRATCKIAI
jgi:hypothetical protein